MTVMFLSDHTVMSAFPFSHGGLEKVLSEGEKERITSSVDMNLEGSET
jgi:hypothetical protein